MLCPHVLGNPLTGAFSCPGSLNPCCLLSLPSCLVLTSLVQPWYEVASDGDGLGPESVNMWKVPPHASFVHPNSFQDPTKWNGDHVLNGGNKEWAEEDGALHAYNMENWRNKILETQLQRQRQQYMLMNMGGPPNAGALKSKSGQSLRQLQAQSSSHVSQSTVAAAAAAAAAATEKQDLGAMVKQLSAALIHPKNAELPEGRGVRNRGEIGGGRSATKELVKLEEGNQRLLRRVLRQLRHRCVCWFGLCFVYGVGRVFRCVLCACTSVVCICLCMLV